MIDTTKYKWIYLRHHNRFGDLQGILFDLSQTWEQIKQKSKEKIQEPEYSSLIKNICDLRGVNIEGKPIEKEDIEKALEEILDTLCQTKQEKDTFYTKLPSGHLMHRGTKEVYLASIASSVILKYNPDAKRKAPRKYKSGVTASKSVIRSMLPLGYWRMVRHSNITTLYVDDDALIEAGSDFLVDGNHHAVSGTIPTEVFQMARNFQFVFEVPAS